MKKNIKKYIKAAILTTKTAFIRMFPATLAAEIVAQKLYDDSKWLPRLNIDIAFLLEQRLRALTDSDGSNRWIHHRWVIIFNEMFTDLAGVAEFRRNFNYLCLGAGIRNPYSLPLLVFLSGAGKVYIIEPEKMNDVCKCRSMWGLQETVLRVLSGDISSKYFAGDVSERINCFFDMKKLFLNETPEDVLHKNSVICINSFFEDADIEDGSIDFLSSRSALEHVMDYDKCFDKFQKVMKIGGVMYHDIGLAAHSNRDLFEFYYKNRGSAAMRISDGLNELRLSDYLRHLEARGFETRVARKTLENEYRLDRTRIQKRFHDYSDDDLLTSRCVLISRKER